jgi:hypothetical protein
MEDDGGVLGNLPRSRPGRRSDKRAAAPSRVRTDHAEPPEEPYPREPAGDSSIGGVARALTSLAGGGARTAHGIAREALRRLPRP